MNQNPEESLGLIPLVIKFGGMALLLELIVFIGLFFYKRSKKADTTWVIISAVVVMGLTILIAFLKIYLFTLPAYNLTQ